MAEAGVAPLNSKSHSKSCRGRPVHAQSRCFTSTCCVVLASPSLNEGKTFVTGVSQSSFPSSTSRAMSSVVSGFVFEAIRKAVSASTFSGLPSSRTPNPPANTTWLLSSSAIPTPGIENSFIAVSTKSVSCLTRAGSSGCAFFPAKDSPTYPFGRRLCLTSASCAPRCSSVGCAASTTTAVQAVPRFSATANTARRSFGEVSYE